MEGVDGVARSDREHGGHEEAATVENQRHLKLAQQLDVLLSLGLGEVLAFEDVGQDRGAEDASLGTWGGEEEEEVKTQVSMQVMARGHTHTMFKRIKFLGPEPFHKHIKTDQ